MKPLRILHVDDDGDVLDVTREMLESEGFDVVSCRSGVEGYRRARANGFAVQILDFQLEDGMSGRDIIAGLLRDGKKIPPTILYTGASADIVRLAWPLGHPPLVHKPAGVELIQLVHRLSK